jgi:hypothetical protein
MPSATEADIARMRDQLFFEGQGRARKLSRFWLLLSLAAVIASAGVVSNSTATVIGAMIVAPLMVPILAPSSPSCWPTAPTRSAAWRWS